MPDSSLAANPSRDRDDVEGRKLSGLVDNDYAVHKYSSAAFTSDSRTLSSVPFIEQPEAAI